MRYNWCMKSERYESNKKYRLANAAKIAAYQKEYRLKHGRKIYLSRRIYLKKYMKEWRLKNKLTVSAYNKEYAKENRLEISQRNNRYRQEKKKVDKQFLLRTILRGRLNAALKGRSKCGSAVKDLGCSVQELKFYLEGKFTDGMSWENYGLRGWHIDHVIPLSFFDLSNREQFLKACHYTNLQPMWAVENIKKGNKTSYV